MFGEELSKYFAIKDISENSQYIEIRLEELPELMPKELNTSTSVVLDGFCNPVELQSFPLNGIPVYLKVYRRRWKAKGTNKHYSNRYNLHEKGVKATKEFSAFLKETLGQTPSEYNDSRNLLMS